MRLVYLSPVPWHSFSQRPHEFVKWFHKRTDGEVLWLDPYPGRLPNKADFRRVVVDVENKKELRNKSIIPTWLSVLQPRALPIEPVFGSGFFHRFIWLKTFQIIKDFIKKDECMLGIGKPSKMALQLLNMFPCLNSFYDAMDDFPEVHSGISRLSMQKVESDIVSCVTKLIVSSTNLSKKYEKYQFKLTVALNGCAADEFPDVTTLSAQSGATIFGYVGTVSHWFDWELVAALAEKNPSITVRIIGPVMSPPTFVLPENVIMLPACAHEEAIRAMQDFSVGLIPFKKSKLTDSVDPVKYYEYRSLGLPVLTTAFGEMAFREERDRVYFIDDYSEMDFQIKKVLLDKNSASEVAHFRNNNSWMVRFDACGIIDL